VSGPIECPQPSLCGNATTPSTFSGIGSSSKLAAISSAVCAAQFARGDYGDVVSRSGAAVGASITEERRSIGRRAGELQFQRMETRTRDRVLECEIMRVDVIAGFDLSFCASDELSVAGDISPAAIRGWRACVRPRSRCA